MPSPPHFRQFCKLDSAACSLLYLANQARPTQQLVRQKTRELRTHDYPALIMTTPLLFHNCPAFAGSLVWART
jgi:uncharacterized protein YcsI (UPF0317 family)